MPARGEERKRMEEEMGSWQHAKLGLFIFPHCDSPFVNHTLYFKAVTKKTQKEKEWGWGRRTECEGAVQRMV